MFLLRYLLAALLLTAFLPSARAQGIYKVLTGSIHFNSDAPNEIISASSDKLNGAVDTGKKRFTFIIKMASFNGFNSPLQKEHFNENYMESHVYPQASFAGKIIEEIDFSKTGKHQVRAKGKLTIHGESKERIIYANVTIQDEKIEIASDFTVLLADHNIKIPRIVNDKLATEIKVEMRATLAPDK